MEFIKNCKTSALAVNGYATIHYSVFYVKRDGHATADETGIRSTTDYLDIVESELRKRSYITVAHCAQRTLFIFDREGKSDADPPQLEGYQFIQVSRGEMRAVDVGKPTPNLNSTSSGMGLAQGAKGLQAANAKAAQANSQLAGSNTHEFDDWKPVSSSMLHELFISAIASTVSYQLASVHRLIPLNFRTLVYAESVDVDAGENSFGMTEKALWLVTLNVYLTTGGTLVITSEAAPHPTLSPLSRRGSQVLLERSSKRVLRVAPNGALARYVCFDSAQPKSAQTPTGPDRNQPDTGSFYWSEQGQRMWKEAVQGWLRRKGIYLPSLDRNDSWVRIRLSSGTKDSEDDESVLRLGSNRECSWPATLCFFDSSKLTFFRARTASCASQGAPSRPKETTIDSGLSWFHSSDQPGFHDPLRFAQEWFLGKAERDKAIEARRQAIRAEEDAAQIQQETPGDFPSSPFNSRIGAYGDLQAIGGVYPTPPDAVLSHAPAPPSSADAAHVPPMSAEGRDALSVRSAEYAGLERMDSDLTGAEHMHAHAPPELSYQQTPDDVGDDLFGDMDEDEDDFGGNGVTEADFSFFDDPDAEDADEVMEDTKDEIAPESAEKEVESETVLPPDVKADEAPASGEDRGVVAAAAGVSPTNEDTTKHASDDVEHDKDQVPGEDGTSHEEDSHVDRKPHQEAVPSPPLSPIVVKEKLFPVRADAQIGVEPSTLDEAQKGSAFRPLSFNERLRVSDEKYRGAGRFNFFLDNDHRKELKSNGSLGSPSGALPQEQVSISLPPKVRRRRKTNERKPLEAVSSNTILQDANVEDGREGSTEEDADTSSEADSSEESQPGGFLPLRRLGRTSNLKRKRGFHDDGLISMGASPEEFQPGEDEKSFALAEQLVNDIPTILRSFEPHHADWSLSRFPPPIDTISRPSPDTQHTAETGPLSPAVPKTPQEISPVALERKRPNMQRDYIGIAQILVDQVIFSTLDHFGAAKPFDPTQVDAVPLTDHDICSNPSAKVNTAVRELLESATEIDLLQFAAIPDAPPDPSQFNKGQPRPIPRRTAAQGQDGSSGNVYPLPPPHIRVRRGDAFWDLLSPALSFWETLGLAPSGGPKNVLSFCIYPFSEDLKSSLGVFMDNLSGAYESCKLGHHFRGCRATEFDDGLVPLAVHGTVTHHTVLQSLSEICIKLGKGLALIDPDNRHHRRQHSPARADDAQRVDSFVIYIVNPFDNVSFLKLLCAAFWGLFLAYRHACQLQPASDGPRPDVTLQLIPIRSVASADTLASPDPGAVVRLAREVYDRCPPAAPNRDHSPLGIYGAPSIQLEEALPRAVHFKNAPEPPADLLRENSYLHVGYAVSVDGSWVTAAWTDGTGRYQATASYSVVGARSFADVAREVWQTSVEIIQSRRVTWRVCIARAGVMEREEMDAWISHTATTSPLPNPIIVALISLDLHPPLTLTSSLPPPLTTAPTATAFSTPGAPALTPQASTTTSPSADPHTLTPAATPSDHPDPLAPDTDAHLVDLPDESCAAVLAHSWHVAHALTAHRPALATGLLVKRGAAGSGDTARDDDTDDADPTHPAAGPLCVAVHLVWVGAATAASGSAAGGASGVGGVAHDSSGGGGVAATAMGGVGTTAAAGALAGSRARDEALLRELLAAYRALGLLARLRGMRGTKAGAVPWHVCAAVRGVKGLERCL